MTDCSDSSYGGLKTGARDSSRVGAEPVVAMLFSACRVIAVNGLEERSHGDQ